MSDWLFSEVSLYNSKNKKWHNLQNYSLQKQFHNLISLYTIRLVKTPHIIAHLIAKKITVCILDMLMRVG